mgnify:CR=1 FL=1
MAEITVRAIDSALAMEEVQKRLGDDALIISTQRIDGQIEITATDEEVIKSQKENNNKSKKVLSLQITSGARRRVAARDVFVSRGSRRSVALTSTRHRRPAGSLVQVVILRVSEGLGNRAQNVRFSSSRHHAPLAHPEPSSRYFQHFTSRRPQLTIATASVFCHRFFASHSHGAPANDRYVREA